MYMFKCNDKFGVVDSVDSSLYGISFGGYINHSCTPNVAVKAKMIDGTPTILMYAACDLTTGTHLSFDYGDKRPSVPEWMRYTGRTCAPVPTDDTCDDSAPTVDGSISEVTLTSSASGAKLVKTSNAKLVKNKLPKCTYTSDAKVPASKRPCTGLNMALVESIELSP